MTDVSSGKGELRDKVCEITDPVGSLEIRFFRSILVCHEMRKGEKDDGRTRKQHANTGGL